jgi:hypothetical protein
MARKRGAKGKQSVPAIIEEAASASFPNLGLEWKARPDGSAELFLAYEGPLASRGEVFARAGTWRQGSEPWAETRELPLRRQGSRWVGTIPVASGGPVEAVEFVFRAEDEWDNGGRAPLGYYEWNPSHRRIEVR